jgi:hypothetical protein
MTDSATGLSLRKAARLAGFGYLIIIICGIFAHFYVRAGLVVPGDAARTADNIMGSERLFRAGIAGDLIMLITDVIVALALYVLLRPVNKSLALLAAFFRLVQTTISGMSLVNLFMVLFVLSGAGYLAVFEQEHLHALALLFLEAHARGILIGQAFFGLSCLVLGYLVYRSGYMPRVLGVLLVLASSGYLVDAFGNLLLPGHEEVFSYIVAVPAVIAELSLCLWLLLRGGRIPRIEKTT